MTDLNITALHKTVVQGNFTIAAYQISADVHQKCEHGHSLCPYFLRIDTLLAQLK